MKRFKVSYHFIISTIYYHGFPGNVESSVVQRIVGGYRASIEDFPFIVTLYRGGKLHCGGMIIAPDIIVTAAHCVNDPSVVYSVKAGRDNLQDEGVERKVVEINIHPDHIIDLAVIRLESPLDYVEGKIENVNLPEHSESVPLSWGKVAGWGRTYHPFVDPNQLRAVDQKVFPQEYCKTLYYYPRSEHMFCAGRFSGLKGACNGDSGGPFVIGNTLYGVVSGGPKRLCMTGPGIYTNVPYIVDWIKEVAKITN